mgnify:CR=1 FL=1
MQIAEALGLSQCRPCVVNVLTASHTQTLSHTLVGIYAPKDGNVDEIGKCTNM